MIAIAYSLEIGPQKIRINKVLWKGQENGEILWFVFSGIPELNFRVVFYFLQSFIFGVSETPSKTYCIFSQLFLCCLNIRARSEPGCLEKTTFFLPNGGFSW